MNKEHFLIELKLHLRQLSIIDQQAILDKYDAIFTEKMSEGLTEYQITKELGSPKKIATNILKNFDIEPTETPKTNNDWVEFSENSILDDNFPYEHLHKNKYRSTNSGFIRFFQITGIICLNLFFMIWMIFCWAMVLILGWIMSIAFILSPTLGIISLINFSGSYGLFQLSISILLFGIGLIGLIIMFPFSKVSFKLLKNYGKWTFQVLKGERAL